MLHGTNPFSPTVQAWLANLLAFARILIPILFPGLGFWRAGGLACRLPFAPILAYLPLLGFWPAFARRLAVVHDSALSSTSLCGD